MVIIITASKLETASKGVMTLVWSLHITNIFDLNIITKDIFLDVMSSLEIWACRKRDIKNTVTYSMQKYCYVFVSWHNNHLLIPYQNVFTRFTYISEQQETHQLIWMNKTITTLCNSHAKRDNHQTQNHTVF